MDGILDGGFLMEVNLVWTVLFMNFLVSVTVKIVIKKDLSLNPIGLDGHPIAGEPCEEESTLDQAGGAETSPSS